MTALTREHIAEPQHIRVVTPGQTRHPLLDAVWRAALDIARGETHCVLTEDNLAIVSAYIGREDGWFITAERLIGREVRLTVEERITKRLVLSLPADAWTPDFLRAVSLSMPGDWLGAMFLRRAALVWGGVE